MANKKNDPEYYELLSKDHEEPERDLVRVRHKSYKTGTKVWNLRHLDGEIERLSQEIVKLQDELDHYVAVRDKVEVEAKKVLLQDEPPREEP